jgi:hypothetical protein
MSDEPVRNAHTAVQPSPPPASENPSWDEILKQLEIAPSADDHPAWQTAVEHVNLHDPSRILEGQRFQGQGQ